MKLKLERGDLVEDTDLTLELDCCVTDSASKRRLSTMNDSYEDDLTEVKDETEVGDRPGEGTLY